MYLYILASALYRLSCGALILAVNWIMVKSSTSTGWLATTVAMTFIPAMVVPFLWKGKSQKFSGKKLTCYSLAVTACISLAMFITDSRYILLSLNTAIWFLFFVMESSWEAWFAYECRSLSDRHIERYSSVSMTANQAALMIGPVVSAYVFENRPGQIILMCMILYIVCFAVSFLSKADSELLPESEAVADCQNQQISRLSISGTEVALLFIWPTLAMFNFMLPAQIAFKHGSMAEVGLLDAVMGVGMIVSGLLAAHTRINNIILQFKLYAVFIIIGMLLWILGDSMIFWLISIFLLGLSFNSQRILLRSRLAKKYRPELVGRIVSFANAFSFILISLSLIIFHSNLSLNWAVPFIFSLIMCLAIPDEIKNNRVEG